MIVNDCVAELLEETLVPSFAVNTMSCIPRSASDGVPANVAVPSPLSVNVSQFGSVPLDKVGTSLSASVVVIVYEYTTPGSAATTANESIAGLLFTWLTVTTLVIVCVFPAPSSRVNVKDLASGTPGLTLGAVNVGFLAVASDNTIPSAETHV